MPLNWIWLKRLRPGEINMRNAILSGILTQLLLVMMTKKNDNNPMLTTDRVVIIYHIETYFA